MQIQENPYLQKEMVGIWNGYFLSRKLSGIMKRRRFFEEVKNAFFTYGRLAYW
jgi:hypothetical protein